jgi:hypothetical protein
MRLADKIATTGGGIFNSSARIDISFSLACANMETS